MVRGTGKFKQKRGGGRSFSKDMAFDNGDRKVHRGGEGIEEEDSDEESGEEESEEEESEEESGEETKAGPELTRTERREMKKKQGDAKLKKGEEEEEEDPDLINPNHVQKKLNISDLNAPRELTRREREQKEKADAKERYWKLHVQGKTDEAKSDLSRLAKIRAEREAALAKRKAEAEAKAQEAEAKKKAQLTKRG
ncbi:casein kinase substrate phosphoprotein PP28-domain-containing protein [Flammula alnicola]|nr:casein kinase substrate phosphoprotein PP28-domain-containing protein [Flammula alnicola]